MEGRDSVMIDLAMFLILVETILVLKATTLPPPAH